MQVCVGRRALLLLEGGDDLTDLAPQTDGVALRNEDYAVEGVCDDEDGEVTSTELHIRDELGEDRTLVIKTEDCTLGKTCEVLWTVAALACLSLKRSTRLRPQCSKTSRSAMMSLSAWFVGSSPAPRTPRI